LYIETLDRKIAETGVKGEVCWWLLCQ